MKLSAMIKALNKLTGLSIAEDYETRETGDSASKLNHAANPMVNSKSIKNLPTFRLAKLRFKTICVH